MDCVQPFIFNPKTCQCQCGIVLNCIAPFVANYTACKCQCGTALNCVTPYIPNYDLCNCQCGVSLICPPPQIFNQRACKCQCPYTDFPIACLAPFYYDTTACRCLCGLSTTKCLPPFFVDTTSCRCQCKQNVDCAPQYYFNTVTCGCVPCLSGMICASTTGSGTAALPWFHPQHNHLNQYMPLLLKWIFSFLYILSCRNEENEFWILIHWYNMINAKLNSNLKWWILILFLMNDNVDKNILNNECSD